MKRIASLAVMFIMLLAFPVVAAGPFYAETSGEKTADAAIMTGEGYFYGIVVMPDGTNAVTVSIYDNASAASGTELVPTLTFAGDGGAQAFAPPYPIRCGSGIYVDVTTAGTVAYTVLKKAGR